MKRRLWFLPLLLVLPLLIAGCAPGNARFSEASPAGFWAGLWHGFICLFTFLIGLFSDQVRMYEIHNAGNWYNFGFLLGVICFFGGGWGSHCGQRRKSRREREWEEISAKVEEKVRRGLKRWLDEKEKTDPEWEETAQKIEEKIKRELKEWADQ
jgi:hypothetical protein